MTRYAFKFLFSLLGLFFGTGFYANAGLQYNSETSSSTNKSETYTGSEMYAGGDVVFQAGNDMAQAGSVVAPNGEFRSACKNG
ncbi:hypothetical protein AGMMS49941_05370 [Deferribacterales bacterium]|nr:hypothetical protein AGMMS49941_05370 [Deferribacterales bacterium]